MTYCKVTVIKTAILAKEWTNRSMEQNWEPRINPHKCSHLTKEQSNSVEKRQSFQQMELKWMDMRGKKKSRHRPYIVYKN